VPLDESELAQHTARAGLMRAGTGRAGALAKSYELKAGASGEFIWDRPEDRDGNPASTASSWTNGRE
jgi:hypothetical protein